MGMGDLVGRENCLTGQELQDTAAGVRGQPKFQGREGGQRQEGLPLPGQVQKTKPTESWNLSLSSGFSPGLRWSS